MTHSRMLDRLPSVLITSNRNELKLYNGNVVYLNDGDNFELRFFNPLQEKIGVEIMFNGIRKGEGYLVLNPGQDLILDRFLDEQRKMLFETYVVDGNNEEAVKAIEKNGVISFNFYKEACYSNYKSFDVNVNYNFPPKPTNYDIPYYNSTTYGSTNVTYTSGVYTTGVQGTNGPSGTKGFSCSRGVAGTPMFGSTLSSSSSIFMDSFDSPDYASEINSVYLSNNFTPLETGRIEKGEFSDQKLKGVNMQFNSLPFHSITYKIMPFSTMNRTLGEIRQYCSDCGYRLRKENWKFCPKCGNKLN